MLKVIPPNLLSTITGDSAFSAAGPQVSYGTICRRTSLTSGNTPTTHSSVSPCLLTIHPTVCLYSLRVVLLKSDNGSYKTGCSSTRTSRRHSSLALLISCVPPTQPSSHRYTSPTFSYRWPTSSVSCWIAVWLSTNTLWRRPGRAISMHEPSAIYAIYCRPIWHRHWPAV